MTRTEIMAFIDWCPEIDPPYTVVGVNPQLINHDHLNYQRPRIEKKVKKFVKRLRDWGDDAYVNFPVAIVFKREDGSFWSLDSQHHTEAALRINMPLIPALVIISQGIAWEVEIFMKLQNYQGTTKEKT